ncbi:MAG TPA: DUF2330 domain-containing protein [Nitrospiria bacterium]|nr:DUF2330 domain-containing protein [Nitrospiria bacterium]
MVFSVLAWTGTGYSFCGFYVGKAGTKLFNQASQVVLARHDGKTVITMSNDFKGDFKEFAMVIPVPTVLEKGQIHVGDRSLIDHLDAYTAPRLVEYFDENPCRLPKAAMRSEAFLGEAFDEAEEMKAKKRGVMIEARYTVGEYDILILSAKQSTGLETWLRENGYKIPKGASRVIGDYLKQGMKFFVAKVNLEEQAQLGFQTLRPIQIAYESPKFMLPIRLGMVNADGPQELFVYTLTRKGRVETTNYRSVKLPTGMDIPVYIKEDFGAFYKAMFTEQTNKEKHEVLFTEYAWDMNWCDPCAADPLSRDQLRRLGVFWLNEPIERRKGIIPRRQPAGPVDVFVTRLHLRYDAAHFPEDLAFQETADRNNFQARYVLRHPWKSSEECSEAVETYNEQVKKRREKEARTLASLTGWDIGTIRDRMGIFEPLKPIKWYHNIWK